MNCKKARGLILTDYLDDQMNEKDKARIEEHLAGCHECKEFSIVAIKAGNTLFRGADRADVPEYLWRRVRETILAEERGKKNFFAALFGKLKAILYIPKPALAIVTVIVLLLAIGTAAKIKIDNKAESEYFDYLTADAADSSLNDNGAFGTSIEKYFM